MSTSTALLQSMAEALGLATSFHDFWGQHHTLGERTLQTLLGAMGIDVHDELALRQQLDNLRNGDAERRHPGVWVLRQGERDSLELDAALHAHTWHIQGECGEQWQGLVDGTRLHWPAKLPLGYHTLSLHDEQGARVGEGMLILCPPRCFEPEALRSGERWWGPTVQLYALRSERNWGMGDFTDLCQVIEMSARQGASFVGLNPLHALFPHDPHRASPYSPSSRAMLNTLYVDVEAVHEYGECTAASDRVQTMGFQRRLQALREAPHIDYEGVARAKQQILALLYRHFRQQHLAQDTHRAGLFRAFQRERGHTLRTQALFDALQAHFHAQDHHVWGWPAWPEAYRQRHSPQVQAFEQAHVEEIEYQEYLQWQCDLQLEGAKRLAHAFGMPLGLYMDVAVGVNEGGADTWAQTDLYALGVFIGAPPEDYNPSGQNWGLPPMRPRRLRELRYQPFIDMLRGSMRHAGALRLDHVMFMDRLFWVPPEEGASAGTYMRYPLADLCGILALESMRHHCLVVGEDLGTVEPAFRDRMRANGVLSYCPLYFERLGDGRFRPPGEYKNGALAVVGTHDLPTLRSWWRGDDIELRARLKLFPSDSQRHQQVIDRANERVQLLWLLETQGLWPQGSSINPGALDDSDPRFTEAVYTLVGMSQAWLAGVQLEDVIQQLEQVNVPGTSEQQHPNWRVKLGSSLEDLQQDARWQAVCQAFRQTRPRAGQAVQSQTGMPPMDSAVIPRATYRLQFHAGMRFSQATAIVPYLEQLGVSHLYASPYLMARAGSTHGYDIVNHNALNPDIGDEQDHAYLCAALKAHNMRQLLDIVPNHMGVLEADNAWWLDVLECGPASRHAIAFDIEWQPAAPELRGKVLLPVLGDHYGRVLEAGELALVFNAEEGSLALRYHGHRFPIDPCHYPDVFAAAGQPPLAQADDERALPEVQSLIDALAHLPPRDTEDPAARALRQRDKALLKKRLAQTCAQHPWVRHWLQAGLDQLNGHVGEPASFDALDRLIGKQAYRLAFWRVAGDDVNYRRFFDISTLAALRMDRPEVFDATHQTVLNWLSQGKVAGLRVDHPDGLNDPQAYFQRLQMRYAQDRQEHGLTPQALYIAAEKILADHERVPDNWPVHGGTGYRFANLLNGLFVDSANEAAMDAAYEAFIGHPADFSAILREAKLLIMPTSLGSDLQLLTEHLHRIAQMDRRSRDFTRNRLRTALIEVTAGLPVYRTYISERQVNQTDRRHLAWACAQAKRHSTASEVSAIDFLRDLLLQTPSEADPAKRQALLAFTMRWQQFSASVMAKSMEDTAFYRYHRLVSLNDVGGDPRRFGTSLSAFHGANAARLRFHPHSMLCGSTHDSKRSEDVRARLNVLSEMPQAWQEATQRWQAQNRPLAERNDADITREDEYLLYQTLVGMWPLSPPDQAELDSLRERAQAYMLKAMREAKVHTSWINPNLARESSMKRFIDLLLGTLEPNPFLKDLQAFVQPLARLGCLNSLNQLVLKLTTPGVPDIYQGCETWQFNLVDPDNRRPVPFRILQSSLDAVQSAFHTGQIPLETLQGWVHEPASGHIKMLLTWRLLALRRRVPELFAKGGYKALEAHGPAASRVVAFMRQPEDRAQAGCVVLCTRLLHGAAPGDWLRTSLPWPAQPSLEGVQWADWLTGRPLTISTAEDNMEGQATSRELGLSDVFSPLPMAVLVPAHWLNA